LARSLKQKIWQTRLWSSLKPAERLQKNLLKGAQLASSAKLIDLDDDGSEKAQEPVCFWEAAMQNLPQIEDRLWIQEWDKRVLQYCRDVTLDGDDLNKGFTLTFHFLENPYFTNCTLEKEYNNFKSSPNTGDSDAMEIKATEIDWKPGKDATVEKVKGSEEEQPRFSFFRNFFCNLKQGGSFPDQFDEDSVRKMTGMDDRERMMEMLDGVQASQSYESVGKRVEGIKRWWGLTEAFLQQNSTTLGEAALKIIAETQRGDVFPEGMDANWALDVQSAQTLDFLAANPFLMST